MMEIDKISEQYIAPCFVNGLEAYDGEVNLEFDENLISNEFADKLCLDYEVMNGKNDLFEDDSEKTGKSSNDWDQLLDSNFDDVPKFGEELPPFICKIGNSNRNKKRTMENLNLFYQDIRPSSSVGKEARPVIEKMAYNDKYKKILDEIWRDKVELDGKTVKEEEDAVKRTKGKALKEKDNPGAFIFPIRLERKVNKNALANTRADINTVPY
nr:hypothetical protein [Tanacetum cinerariifolium]